MKQLIFIVVILLLLSFVPSIKAEDIGEIYSGETKTCNITKEGQTDSFAFYGEKGQGVIIEMAAIDGNLGPSIDLYRPNATLEKKVVGGYRGNRIRIEKHQLEQTGNYTIVAAASWATYTSKVGNYGLSLVLIHGATSSGQDPDGGGIASGQTYSSTIIPQSDTDSFTFYGEKGQGVIIEMAAIDGNLGPSIDLYRPNATLEKKVVGGYRGNRIRIEKHQLEQTGNYTIVAAASWATYTSKVGNSVLR